MGSRLKPGDPGYRAESYNPAIDASPVGKEVTKQFARAEGLKTDDKGVVLPASQQSTRVQSEIASRKIRFEGEGKVNLPIEEGKVNFPPPERRPTINRMSERQDQFRFGDPVPPTPRVGGILDTRDIEPRQTRLQRAAEIGQRINPFNINRSIVTRTIEKGKQLSERERDLGTVGGSVPGIGLARGAAPKAAKVLFTGSGAIARGVRGIAGTEAIFQGIIKGEQATRGREQRETVKSLEQQNIDFGKEIDKALREEAIKISGTTKDEEIKIFGKQFQPSTAFFGKPLTLSPRNIVFNIPGGQFITGDKETFKKTFIENLKAQGVSTEEATKAANIALRARTARGSAEVGAALNIERGLGESIGRGLTTRAFVKQGGKELTKKQAGSQLFKTVGGRTAIAGFAEGSVGEIYSRRARGFDQDLKGTLFAGGLGAGTAGLLGGSIARTSVTSPRVSTFLRRGSYFLDPYEKPGDVFQDITERAIGRVTRKTNIQPTVISRGGTFTFGVGTPTTTATETDRKRKTKGTTKTQTKTRTQPYTFQDLVTFSETTPDVTPSETPSTTKTPDGTIGKRQENIEKIFEQRINQFSQTTTNTFTGTATNVPTSTPLFRILPPVPLTLPFGGGRSGLGSARGKKYVNELIYGRGVLTGLLGTSQRRKPQTNVKKKIKRKKK